METKVISGGNFMAGAFDTLEALRSGVQGLEQSLAKHGIPPEQIEAARVRAAMLLAVMKSANELCRELASLGDLLNAHLNPPKIDPMTLN